MPSVELHGASLVPAHKPTVRPTVKTEETECSATKKARMPRPKHPETASSQPTATKSPPHAPAQATEAKPESKQQPTKPLKRLRPMAASPMDQIIPSPEPAAVKAKAAQAVPLACKPELNASLTQVSGVANMSPVPPAKATPPAEPYIPASRAKPSQAPKPIPIAKCTMPVPPAQPAPAYKEEVAAAAASDQDAMRALCFFREQKGLTNPTPIEATPQNLQALIHATPFTKEEMTGPTADVIFQRGTTRDLSDIWEEDLGNSWDKECGKTDHGAAQAAPIPTPSRAPAPAPAHPKHPAAHQAHEPKISTPEPKACLALAKPAPVHSPYLSNLSTEPNSASSMASPSTPGTVTYAYEILDSDDEDEAQKQAAGAAAGDNSHENHNGTAANGNHGKPAEVNADNSKASAKESANTGTAKNKQTDVSKLPTLNKLQLPKEKVQNFDLPNIVISEGAPSMHIVYKARIRVATHDNTCVHRCTMPALCLHEATPLTFDGYKERQALFVKFKRPGQNMFFFTWDPRTIIGAGNA